MCSVHVPAGLEQCGSAFEIVQERFQHLVQDLVGDLDLMDAAAAGPISGVAVQFLDAQPPQRVRDTAHDRGAVFVRL